jgi:hypothetical protein
MSWRPHSTIIVAIIVGSLCIDVAHTFAEDIIYAVNDHALLTIEGGSGRVLHETEVGTLFGHISLASDGNRVFIISGADTVLSVDPRTDEVDTVHTYCCLSGSIAATTSQLYVLSAEEHTLTLTGFDKITGQGMSVVGIPQDVLAVTVVDQGPNPSATATATPILTPTEIATTPPDPPVATGGGCNINEVDSPTVPWVSLLGLILLSSRRRWCLLSLITLMLPVAASAVSPGEPFVQGATVSIDNGPATALVLSTAPSEAATAYVSGGQPAMPSGCTAGASQSCSPIPVPSTITNWNTFYHVEFGIEVTNEWKQFRYGSEQRLPTIDDVLRHLRDTFATINAVFKRDVGAILQIRHVRILDQISYPLNSDGSVNDFPSYAYWAANLPSVRFVYRLIPQFHNYGGGAGGSLCTGTLGGGHENYDLAVMPSAHDDLWLGSQTRLGHELSHIFGGSHTGWYNPPIEQCNDDCYQGQLHCPNYDDQSWSGYCFEQYNCSNNGGLRFGPLFGPMARVIRQYILNATCLPAGAVFGGDRTVDNDGDKFPDQLDNCPTIVNVGQEDRDEDGVGDDCDNCPSVYNPSQADNDADAAGDACEAYPRPQVDDDTFITNVSPGGNHGGDTFMRVGRQPTTAKGGTPNLYRSLIHFDLNGAIPSGKTVDGAKLWLNTSSVAGTPTVSIQRLMGACSGGSNAGSPCDTNADCPGSTCQKFTESAATWNNQESTSGVPAPLTKPIPTASGWTPVDVGPLAVDCWRYRAGQCYWRLSAVNETDNTTSSTFDISSKEASPTTVCYLAIQVR